MVAFVHQHLGFECLAFARRQLEMYEWDHLASAFPFTHIPNGEFSRVAPVMKERGVIVPSRYLGQVFQHRLYLSLANPPDEFLKALLLVTFSEIEFCDPCDHIRYPFSRDGSDRLTEGSGICRPLTAENYLEVRDGETAHLTANAIEA